MLSSTLPLAVVGATVVGFSVGFNVGATATGVVVSAVATVVVSAAAVLLEVFSRCQKQVFLGGRLRQTVA